MKIKDLKELGSVLKIITNFKKSTAYLIAEKGIAALSIIDDKVNISKVGLEECDGEEEDCFKGPMEIKEGEITEDNATLIFTDDTRCTAHVNEGDIANYLRYTVGYIPF